MKRKLQDAIGMIGEDLIASAKSGRKKMRRFWKTAALPAVAVLLITALVCGGVYWRGGFFDPPIATPANPADPQKDHIDDLPSEIPNGSGGNQKPNQTPTVDPKAESLVLCSYPTVASFPDLNKISDEEWHDVYQAWRKERATYKSLAEECGGINAFVQKTMVAFLEKGEGNALYSPLNLYLALAMLAEATEGAARAEILGLLDAESLSALRQKAKGLWESHYRADGAVGLVLASSLWLAEELECDQATLDRLKDNYYTSVFRGEMGSEGYNQALRDWLNEQTDGLLQDYVSKETMDSGTLFNLVTSVYYSAKWDQSFWSAGTGVFHGTAGDINCGYMKNSDDSTYYWGENFGAVDRSFKASGGSMRFILPDKDVNVDSLLTDSEVLQFISGHSGWANSKRMIIHHTIPKFDVSAQVDLVEGLKGLGVSKVFSSMDSFSPLVGDQEAYLNSASHTARVMIDEDGCKAAAYTEMAATGDPPPPDEEIDFVLDRPFVFVIYSEHDVPLFVGVVNQP
ncbi:MAG: hypothetical protein IJC46_08505 [Clostridia bacterium]|nr:hypothetical protein [Clostridia bacterium]